VSSEKTALLIAYLFPPIGGIAVQRPLKFARYLQNSGWDSVVLTTADVPYATMDASLLAEVPSGVTIERVPDVLARFAGTLNSGTIINTTTPQVKTTTTSSLSSRRARLTILREKLKGTLRGVLKRLKNSLLIPDESVLWAIYAGLVGQRLVKKYNIKCIYSTSGPHSTHIAAWLIHRFTGVPWVADFRDPWTDNFHYFHPGARRGLERHLERAVFTNANRVVTVTDGFKAMFDAKYPLAARRIKVIRNGVDPFDFPPTAVIASNFDGENEDEQTDVNPFTFFYAGILYPKRSPEAFLRGLANCIANGRIPRGGVRVQFAGVFDYQGQTANHDLVESLGLGEIVDVMGYMPREQVLAKMQQVDGLLLIGEAVPEAKMYVPGKLYEYLCAGTPILALMEDGEGARLIREAQAGCVIPADDESAAEEAIVSMVVAHGKGELERPDKTYVQQFTRQAQTKQLAAIMDGLVQTMPLAAADVEPCVLNV